MIASTFLGWWAFLLVTFGLELPTAQGKTVSSKVQKNIRDLIDFNVEEHYKPTTVRLEYFLARDDIWSESFSSFVLDVIKEYPRLLGGVKPLKKSLSPNSISTRRRIGSEEVFRYVTVIVVEECSESQAAQEVIGSSVNTRWDRLIVISPCLNQIMKSDAVQTMKDKFGLDTLSGDLWVEPSVYIGGNFQVINSIEEYKTLPLMGKNLRGRHFKVGWSTFLPWAYQRTLSDGRKVMTGDTYNVTYEASKAFNFTYEIARFEKYAVFINGTWGGMISCIFYPENGCHFTFYLGQVYSWSYGVDYTSSLDVAELKFMTGQPSTKTHWYSFLLPFSPHLWACIVSIFLIIGIVQFFVMLLYHHMRLNRTVWDSAILLPYAMAMEQGLCYIPKGARYLSIIWLLGCVVLGTGYKSTLRTHLTYPTPERIPTSFPELERESSYEVTLLIRGIIEKEYFYESNLPVIVNLAKRLKFNPSLDDWIENSYLKRKSAFFGWYPPIKMDIARKITVNPLVDPLASSSDSYYHVDIALGFPRDSIYVDAYSKIVAASTESGLVDKWKSIEHGRFKNDGIERMSKIQETRLYKLLSMEANADPSVRKPLNLNALKVVFALLPGGYFLAFIAFLCEKKIF